MSLLGITTAHRRAVTAGLALDALVEAGVEVTEDEAHDLRRAVVILEAIVVRTRETLEGLAGADDYP